MIEGTRWVSALFVYLSLRLSFRQPLQRLCLTAKKKDQKAAKSNTNPGAKCRREDQSFYAKSRPTREGLFVALISESLDFSTTIDEPDSGLLSLIRTTQSELV